MAGLLLIGAGLASAGSAPVAQAHHNDGTKLCNQKFQGTFTHWGRDGISWRRGPLGRLSYNYSLPPRRDGYAMRLCVVTIRAGHKQPRFTGVRIKAVKLNPGFIGSTKWRRDASHDYRYYAGPLVDRANLGFNRLKGRGTIGKAYCKFSLRYVDTSVGYYARLRSRCYAPDGHAYIRRTRWLDALSLGDASAPS